MKRMNGCLFLAVASLASAQALDRGAVGSPIAHAAEQDSKEIMAAQIRKQGYRCSRAVTVD